MLTNLYDNARSGNNPYETALTPAVVASSAFGVLGTYVVEGAVYSQVLIMTNVAFQMPNGTPIRCCSQPRTRGFQTSQAVEPHSYLKVH